MIAQQNWLIDVLATQLDAEGKVWQRARRLVMEIGYQAKIAFAPESFDVTAPDRRAGRLNKAIGFIPDTRVQVATRVTGVGLDGVELFFMAIEDKPPPGEEKIEEILSGATTRT